MHPGNLKAVLFDFHNTLATCDGWLDLEINTLPWAVTRRLLASEELGVGLSVPDEAALREAFRRVRARARETGVEISALEGARLVLTSFNLRVSEEALQDAVAHVEEALLPQVQSIEGALDTLEALRQAGYLLGVVSSAGWPQFVEMALEKEGMRPFFSAVLTSASEGLYKSDPRIFSRACERLGVRPAQAAHVGDHARYDVISAQRAGLRAVWFAAHSERTARLHAADWEELQRHGAQADAVIHSLDELPGLLERMTSA